MADIDDPQYQRAVLEALRRGVRGTPQLGGGAPPSDPTNTPPQFSQIEFLRRLRAQQEAARQKLPPKPIEQELPPRRIEMPPATIGPSAPQIQMGEPKIQTHPADQQYSPDDAKLMSRVEGLSPEELRRLAEIVMAEQG